MPTLFQPSHLVTALWTYISFDVSTKIYPYSWEVFLK